MSLKKAVNFVLNPLATVVGGKTGRIMQGVVDIGVGIATGNPMLVSKGMGNLAAGLKKGVKPSASTLDRLNADVVVDAPRKAVLGRTAMNTDIRYGAYTGSSQEYWEQIVCTASHEVEAHEEIWFDTELAWTSAGGAQGRFAGYLTVTSRLVGTSSNGIAIDSVWTTACTLTGCSYLHMKFRLTGTSKKAESPFASGIPTRMTIRGKGAKVPDPRLSTTAGGSGSQNMADQATWAYTTAADSGRNLACQVLFYLMGWKINSKLAIGKGISSTRINFASFIAAANICDESVTKLAGGTRSRYRGDGVFSEADDPATVLTGLLQAMNAELTDEDGKIALKVDYDDLATPAVALTEDDIVDGDDWQLSNSSTDVNIVKGQFVDPSDAALYQLRDYPQVTLAGADYGSPDGIQRIDHLPLAFVQDPEQAQYLAGLRLQRYQYPGTYTARFKKKAWAAGHRKIVTLTHSAAGMAAKKWRVERQRIARDGTVGLVLREVASAMYAAPSLAATVAAAAPTAFNPLNHPLATLSGTDIGVANNAGTTLAPFVTLGAAASTRLLANSVESLAGGAWNVFYAPDRFPKTVQLRYQVDGLSTNQSGAIALRPGALPTINGDPNGVTTGHYMYFFNNTLYQIGVYPLGVATLSRPVSLTAVYSIVIDNDRVRFFEGTTELGTAGGYPVYWRDADWHISGQMLGAGPRFYNIQAAPFTDVYANNIVESTTRKWAGETGADVATDVVGQADIVIAADYNGVPKTGELTKTLAYRLFRAGTQVTSGITWSRTVLSGNATTAVSGSGTATFEISGPANATLSDESVVRVTATPSTGAARYLDVTIRRVKDPAPTGSTGGSGNPGTTVATSTIASISSTTHAVIAGPIRVRAGTGGQIRCTFPASFKRTSSATGQTGELAKVQWSTVGGVMADIAAETASSSNAQTTNDAGDPTIQAAGSISVDVTKTGLTSGVDYDVQLLGRKSDVSGTTSNIYTAAGSFTAAGS